VNTQARRRSTLPGARVLSDGHVLYWWVELLAILTFYVVYSFVRNLNGAHPPAAFPHARQIITIEHWLGIYHEETIQKWALHFRPLIIAANYFYGSLHFLVTIFAGVFLFRKFSDDYPRYRNTLAIATHWRSSASSSIHSCRRPAPHRRVSLRLRHTPEKDPASGHQPGGVPSFESACGDAQRGRWQHGARRTGAAPQIASEGACVLLPDRHLDRHRDHGEPLLPGCRGGLVIPGLGWIIAPRNTPVASAPTPHLPRFPASWLTGTTSTTSFRRTDTAEALRHGPARRDRDFGGQSVPSMCSSAQLTATGCRSSPRTVAVGAFSRLVATAWPAPSHVRAQPRSDDRARAARLQAREHRRLRPRVKEAF
jgi:hypothetical protein